MRKVKFSRWLFFCIFLGRSNYMSEDQNKLGEMFKKALANRAAKEQEEKIEEDVEEKQEEQLEQSEKIIKEQKEEEQNSEEEEIIEEVFEEENVQEEPQTELEQEPEEDNNEESKKIINSEEVNKRKFEKEKPPRPFRRMGNNRNTTMIEIEMLEEFPNQPFKRYSEEKEKEMIDSIKVNGIIQDLIVRPLPNGKYQILSGHNRKNCAIKAGLTELPCKIRDVDDDTAQLMLVDTNLVQRKEFYPSETAKALKIKKEIYKKKEVKSDFFDEIIKEQNMSRGNVQRYLRLNYLIPELMDRVDTKEINLKNAEDLSFLTKEEQIKLEEMLEAKPRKLTSNQTKRLREESDKNNLTERTLKTVLENDEKEDDKDIEIKFTKDEVDKYFKDFDSIKEIKEFIISMFEELITTPDKKEEVKTDG